MRREDWLAFRDSWGLLSYSAPTPKMQAWLLTLLEKGLVPDGKEGGGIPAYGCRKRGLSEWLWEVSGGARLGNADFAAVEGYLDPAAKCLGEQLTPAGRALAEKLREEG